MIHRPHRRALLVCLALELLAIVRENPLQIGPDRELTPVKFQPKPVAIRQRAAADGHVA